MSETDEKKITRNMAIARFAKFVEKYIYDTDWTLIATMTGTIDNLNEDRHERVRRAQSWKDPDYPLAISKFLLEIFNINEQVGFSLINEIIQGVELSPEAKNELTQLLSIIGNKNADIESLAQDFQFPIVENLIQVTWIPDDFYKKLINEINHLYINRLPMSLSILIRKLFENLIIDILRKKYGTTGISLYYNPPKGRFHDFFILLKNLDSKKDDFHYITASLDASQIKKINRYRESGNSGAHSIDVNHTVDQIYKDKENINYSVQLLLRILQNI